MAEKEKEQVVQKQAQEVKVKTAATGNPAQVLEDSCAKLVKFGGFDLLEMTVEGAQNMNPERKARKKIFISDSDKKKERQTLKVTLALWIELLESSDSVPDLVAKCESKADATLKLLNANLKKAVDTSRELEVSYRTVHLFYKNTEQSKIKNISIMNADPSQVQDLDTPKFIEKVAEELKHNYDRLDLRNNYSIMVIPGFLGKNSVVDRWAKMAAENKVMLLTDFRHLDSPDDVMDLFESANLTSGDAFKSNIMMCCNYAVGRGKYEELGEEDDLYVPPSAALAGKIYNTLMSQVAAGFKFGGLSELDGVKFEMKKSEIAELEKMGLIPLVKEKGKVMAFSAKTLFNGDNLGLQTYSVVRVFDWILKVLMDFLNRRAFENWSSTTQKDLREQIVKFLDSIQGPGRIIENFNIMKFERDPNQKDRILLDIHMTPYFPAKSFMIKLGGQKGDDASSWAAQYEQQDKK